MNTVLKNDYVVLERIAEVSDDELPPLPPKAASVYWLTGNDGGRLEATVGGRSYQERAGIRLTLLESADCTVVQTDAQDLPAVGTRLLYTDNQVNIWEFCIKPGERCHYHKHHLPYLYTNLTESLTQELDQDGKVVADPRLQKLNQTTFLTKKELGEHAVLNVGNTLLLQFIVELKRS